MLKRLINPRAKGIALAIVSSIGFGVMPFFVKDAANQGLDTFNVILYRYLFAGIFIFMIIKAKKIPLKLEKKEIITASILGGIGYILTSLFLFLSYNYISTGLATTLHFTYAAFVSLIMTLFFKEKLNSQKIIAIILSIVGVSLFAQDADVDLNIIGASFALITGVTYAVYMVGLGKSSLSTRNAYVVIFYAICSSVALLFLTGLFSSKLQFELSGREFIDITCLALLCTVISSAFVFEAIKLIGVTETAILSTLEPIVCMVIGIMYFEEAINTSIVVGSLLILTSVVIIAKSKAQKQDIQLKVS